MIVRSKGTVCKMAIASVLTAITQMISLDLPEGESETFEADYLDNPKSGIPYKSTGRTEGGELAYEGWFDPSLAGHQAITDLLTTPPADGVACRVVFADDTEWDFTAAGCSLGVSVQLKEGLKFKGKFKLDGTVAYPT